MRVMCLEECLAQRKCSCVSFYHHLQTCDSAEHLRDSRVTLALQKPQAGAGPMPRHTLWKLPRAFSAFRSGHFCCR